MQKPAKNFLRFKKGGIMLNKINNCIKEHLIGLENIIILLAIIVSVFFNQKIEFENTLLLFICIEQMIIVYGYLETIISHTKKSKNFIQTITGVTDLKKLIASAKHDITIIGSTLKSIDIIKTELRNLSDKVDLKLYSVDSNYISTVGDAYKMMGCKELKEFRDRGDFFSGSVWKYLKERTQNEFHYINSLVPITYIGIDIKEHSLCTAILAEHYLFDNSKQEGIAFLVKPGTELFYIYAKEISYLINQVAKEGT